MAKFEIIGNAKLSGEVKIAGNKNAVLPIMAACLLTEDTCTLENVPLISDVVHMAKLLEAFLAKIPMKRMGEPDDIGKVALFLASDMASYITGSQIVVDGGYLLS